MPAQPQDEWTFLRPEEFADDDAVERIDAIFDTSAEENAVHMVDLDDGDAPRAALDPGETRSSPVRADDMPMAYFDDEEPEASARRDGSARPQMAEPDEEPGVDELLVSQHYSFDGDGQ